MIDVWMEGMDRAYSANWSGNMKAVFERHKKYRVSLVYSWTKSVCICKYIQMSIKTLLRMWGGFFGII